MKNELITFRVTTHEKEIIKEEAQLQNISVSNLFRRMLKNYHSSNNTIEENAKVTPEVICNLLTNIQKLRQENPDIDLDKLEERVAKLWQL